MSIGKAGELRVIRPFLVSNFRRVGKALKLTHGFEMFEVVHGLLNFGGLFCYLKANPVPPQNWQNPASQEIGECLQDPSKHQA